MAIIKGEVDLKPRDSIFSNDYLCPYETTEFIYQELLSVNKQITKVKTKFIHKARENCDDIIEVLKQEHMERVTKRARESWYNSECIDPNLGILQPKPLKRNEACVKSQRKRFTLEKPIKFPVERIPFYTGDHAPILIENVYKQPKKSKRQNRFDYKGLKKTHVFIMIHGLDSSYVDLIPLMNEISIVTPNADFIMPECIGKEASRSRIATLGEKVAEEIISTLNNDYDEDEIGKISFICHSLGGLIARAAFPYLYEYFDLFYSYCSLASPHLGILNADSFIALGAYISELFYSYDCIKELRLADDSDVESTYLFELSENEGFEYFEYIYYIASPQDNFAPYYSARVQMFKDDLNAPNASKL